MSDLTEILKTSRRLILSGNQAVESASLMAIDEKAEQGGLGRSEAELFELAVKELTGLGQLQPYMDNPGIEEIWINRPNEIHYFDSRGHHQVELDLSFAQIRSLVFRMLKDSGRRIDRITPYVDAALTDGSRLHVVIPEVTRAHWSINIRKFRKSLTRLDDLQAQLVITESQREFLTTAMHSHKSMLIAGATQAGKTTLMTALLN